MVSFSDSIQTFSLITFVLLSCINLTMSWSDDSMILKWQKAEMLLEFATGFNEVELISCFLDNCWSFEAKESSSKHMDINSIIIESLPNQVILTGHELHALWNVFLKTQDILSTIKAGVNT